MTEIEKKCSVPIDALMPIIQLQLERGGKAPLQVTGNSMYPMLRHRKDAVLLEPICGALRKGELIFYRRENGAYILHRIIKVTDTDSLICCGDNQYEPEPVDTSQVIARVTAFTRNEKDYLVTARMYRLYVWLWTGLFPVRRPLLALRRGIGSLRVRLRKKINR